MVSRDAARIGQYGWAMVTGGPAHRSEADLDRLRRRVINVVGHELRTPVTTIRGLAELLGGGDSDPEVAAALVREARRLESLLDQLLVAAGVSAALPVDQPAPVRLVPAITGIWAGLGARADLIVDSGPADEGVAALAGPSALDQMLRALLDNAAAHGDPPVQVKVTGAAGRVQVTVESGGPVVPPEDVAMALEPFWRGERAVTARPGLGLGLPVAKAMAEHAGGSLMVSSRPGGGLIATLELPAG